MNLTFYRAGIDPKLLLNIINSSTGRSWFTEEYCPVPGLIPTAPSSRDYKNGFNNDLMVKVSILFSLGVDLPFFRAPLCITSYTTTNAAVFSQF